MSKDPNLLEAFRSASQEAHPEPSTPKSPPGRGAASGRGGGGGASLSDRWGALPPFARLLPLVLLAFLFGVFVGRSTRPVSASEGHGEYGAEAAAADLPAAQEPARVPQKPATQPQAPAAGDTEAAPSALFDRTNQYTVVVVTYGLTMQEPAWGTFDFLKAEGIPVFPPYRVGDKIVVFAGAAPTRAALESLEARVKGLSRDGRRGTYGDAYIDRIDDYMSR
ncbi:MAG TPA: hypothetical protein ENJ09_11660 [Planctomycetes bacterium]|nr:hypothetical protein [Planctomycetota bacterium]